MTFAEISRVVGVVWPRLLVLLIAGALGGFLLGRSLTPSYISSAAVVVRSATDEGAPTLLSRVPSYAQLVATERVLGPVERELGVSGLDEKVNGTYLDGTYLVSIQGVDLSPERARAITAGVADSYVRALHDGFGGAIPKVQSVDGQVVEHADSAKVESKFSPPLLAGVGGLLLPLAALALLLLQARRRDARTGGAQ